MAQMMPLPLTVSCFSKIQIGFTFLVPAQPGSPGQRAVKRVRVCAVLYPQNGDRIVTTDSVTSLSPVRILADADEVWLQSVGVWA